MHFLKRGLTHDGYRFALMATIVVVLALAFNSDFGSTDLIDIEKKNDVGGIFAGYRQTPSLFPNSLRWWNGPWIQQGIEVFRPVSSYLLWFECRLGFSQGFFWVACVGMLLFVADCLLCALLAWRFTHKYYAGLIAAALAPLIRFHNWGGVHPPDWLAWFPVHHDLLMIGFLLGALLAFCTWLDSGKRVPLALTWICFLLGVLSKEFVYIFPVMAAVLAVGRTGEVDRRRALMHVGGFFLALVFLVLYRSHVLPHPYNPRALKLVHLQRKPLLYWFASFYGYLGSAQWWFPGLAALLFAMAGTALRRRDNLARIVNRGFGWILMPVAAAGVIVLYIALTFGNVAEGLWFLFDPNTIRLRMGDLAKMILTIYSIYLIFKYRREEPTIAAWLLMALSYLPVFTYLGWHYTLCGWFMRSAIYWPLVTLLVLKDTRLDGLVKRCRSSRLSGALQ